MKSCHVWKKVPLWPHPYFPCTQNQGISYFSIETTYWSKSHNRLSKQWTQTLKQLNYTWLHQVCRYVVVTHMQQTWNIIQQLTKQIPYRENFSPRTKIFLRWEEHYNQQSKRTYYKRVSSERISSLFFDKVNYKQWSPLNSKQSQKKTQTIF